MKLIWLLCGWSKLTRFWTRVENHLFLVWKCKLTCILCGWSKIELISVCGVELDLILFIAGWNWFDCCVGCRKWLVFSIRIENKWVFVSWHRNRLDIGVGNKIDLISVIGSKLTWFSCAGSKLTWFYRWDQTRLFFVRGSKSTSVLCVDRK